MQLLHGVNDMKAMDVGMALQVCRWFRVILPGEGGHQPGRLNCMSELEHMLESARKTVELN